MMADSGGDYGEEEEPDLDDDLIGMSASMNLTLTRPAYQALKNGEFPPQDCIRRLRASGATLFAHWRGEDRLWPRGGWKRAHLEWFGIEDWQGHESEGSDSDEE
jgi:hypothetical protein